MGAGMVLPILNRGVAANIVTAVDNPIAMENLKEGAMDWELTDPANKNEIEGYASDTSINRGEQISFYVNTADPTYTLEVFRLGWYSGKGARRMMGAVTLPGIKQPLPQPDPTTGLIECRWTNPYVLAVPYMPGDPTDWASGVYLTKLTGSVSGKQSYIIFVVRDDARVSNHLFQSSVTTFQAYNSWGGKSLYDFNSTGGRAFKVSFNRPYDDGGGTGNFVNGVSGWEHNMLRFLEREGYDVTYCTNLDTHAQPNLLSSHKAFLSVGHDEYWSWQMRENVEAARDRGVNLGFFTANTCYWQIRLEPSATTGAANRTIVCYKDYWRDPLYASGDPSNYRLVTTTWRDNPVNRPEDALVGVMYDYYPVDADMVIDAASHWVFAGTGLSSGDRLPGLVGYEADRLFANPPANIVRLAHSPVKADGVTGYSDMAIYTAPSGATVFATGSIQWSWGLDDYTAGGYAKSIAYQFHAPRVSAAAQQITRNALARFIGSISPPFGGGTTQQLLGNPGFENGAANPAPWVVSPGVIDNSTGQPPHTGTWKAWLCGYGATHTDTLSQVVTIPAAATSATLSFWLHIDTSEITGTKAYDTLKVQIRDAAGASVLATLATFSNLDAHAGYRQVAFDISSFKGQTIQVYLVGSEDSSSHASFIVDDFALNVTIAGGADTTPPAISLSSPANGAAVLGIVTVAASASDGAGVTKMEVYLDGSLRASNTNATSLTYSWNTKTASNGAHTIVAKAYDAAGNVGTSSVTVKVTNPVTTELISNGGFEGTLSPWALGGAQKPGLSSSRRHTGSSSMRLGATTGAGAVEPNGDSWAYQSVTIPANVTAARLSFWYSTATADTIQNDWQEAKVLDANGNTLWQVFKLAANDSSWTQQTADLKPFAGRTVRVYFNCHCNGTNPTTLWVDDVSVKVTQ